MSRAVAGFPAVHRATLDNGLRVIVVPLPHLHTAAAGVFVRAGSRYETPKTNGLSHFLEHMLFRGTEAHPTPFAFNLAIESMGGSLRAATHPDFTVYDVTLPPEHVGEGIGLLGEVFTTPLFGDIETEKRIVAEEILGDLDAEGREVDIENLSRKLLFGDHPLAFKITGTAEDVERFTERDLLGHHGRLYRSGNMVLAVAGRVDVGEVMAAAARAFGALPRGERVEVEPPPIEHGRARYLGVARSSSQADLRLCTPTFGQLDPRAPVLAVIARILDDGLSTRVYRRVCEERGLAYDAFAGTETYEDAGVFDLGATMAHERVGDVLEELVAIADQLSKDTVPEDELERAKQRHHWQVVSSLDQVEGIMSFHGVETLLGLDGTLEVLSARVQQVTADDVRAVARDVFRPARCHVVVVGSRLALRGGKRAFDRWL